MYFLLFFSVSFSTYVVILLHCRQNGIFWFQCKKKVTMNYHQFMASLAFITLCQTSYITAHAPNDLLIQMGEGRMIYLFQQKIVSFMNISMTNSLHFLYMCRKIHAAEISACLIQAYTIKEGEFFSGGLL